MKISFVREISRRGYLHFVIALSIAVSLAILLPLMGSPKLDAIVIAACMEIEYLLVIAVIVEHDFRYVNKRHSED
jgi:hypothetical protein